MENDTARTAAIVAEAARVMDARTHLEESFIAGLEPVGEAEMKLVIEIAHSYWRLEVLSQLEEEILASDASGVPEKPEPEPLQSLKNRGRELVEDEAYRTRVNAELARAWNALATLQQARAAGETNATWIN